MLNLKRLSLAVQVTILEKEQSAVKKRIQNVYL